MYAGTHECKHIGLHTHHVSAVGHTHERRCSDLSDDGLIYNLKSIYRVDANGCENVTAWWKITKFAGWAESYQHPFVTGQWNGMLPCQQSHEAGSRLQTGRDRMVGTDGYLMSHVHTDECWHPQSWNTTHKDQRQTDFKEDVHSLTHSFFFFLISTPTKWIQSTLDHHTSDNHFTGDNCVHTTVKGATQQPDLVSYSVAESPLRCRSNTHWCHQVIACGADYCLHAPDVDQKHTDASQHHLSAEKKWRLVGFEVRHAQRQVSSFMSPHWKQLVVWCSAARAASESSRMCYYRTWRVKAYFLFSCTDQL